MAISYNGLWKLLIDNEKKKMDLINDLGISSSTIAKMTRGENVSLSVLEKYAKNMIVISGILLVMIEDIKSKMIYGAIFF